MLPIRLQTHTESVNHSRRPGPTPVIPDFATERGPKKSWRLEAALMAAAILFSGAGALAWASGARVWSTPDGRNSFRASGGRGALLGVVSDAGDDAIPGARVLVMGDDREVLFETATSSSSNGSLPLGGFRLDGIPPGRYSVVAVDAASRRSPELRVPVTPWLDTRVRLHVDTGRR